MRWLSGFIRADSTLSAHFNVLKAANLVQTERQGQTIVYSLNLSVFEETMAAVMAVFGVRDKSGADAPARAHEKEGQS